MAGRHAWMVEVANHSRLVENDEYGFNLITKFIRGEYDEQDFKDFDM